MNTTDPVTTYFEAWRDNDVSRLRTVLADDVFFDGPLGYVEGAPATPVANWSRVEDSLITRIRVTFDPRGMLS